MDEMEVYVLVGCLIAGGYFKFFWYTELSAAWPAERGALAKRVFKLLPAAAAAVIFLALTVLASFDVVESFTFVIFYMAMGFTFICIGMWRAERRFEIAWHYDAVHNANKAAVPAVAGMYIALAVIYSGANIGDGPGWWTVVFAGGLGLAAWLLLMWIFGKLTGMFEDVTVERDVPCGIRAGCYFIAVGIFFGRASSGDWTSFGMTIVEFGDGWPALPFTALLVLIERGVYRTGTARVATGRLYSSILVGCAAIAAAALIVMFAVRPIPDNDWLYGDGYLYKYVDEETGAASPSQNDGYIYVGDRKYKVIGTLPGRSGEPVLEIETEGE